jgi:hypothetical protein
MVDPEWNTEFHMPDSYYEPVNEPEPCAACDGEGCAQCDVGIAGDAYADMLMQRAKDEPDYDRPYDEVHEAFKEANDE